MSGEKTEKPTAQRKKQARREGTIARTPDLGAWAGMLAASIVVPIGLRSGIDRAKGMLEQVPAVIAPPDPRLAPHPPREGGLGAAAASAPVFAPLLVGRAAPGAPPRGSL